MAEAIPMLRREQRRHLLMNGWLIAGFIVVGTAVTNERGIFRPVGLDGISATARAFIAMASPTSLSPLGPRLRDVRSVSALDPFDVTAPSPDVRRRLVDAIDWVPGQENVPPEPLGFNTANIPPNLTLADNGVPALPIGDGPAFIAPPEQLGVSRPVQPVGGPPGLDTGAVPEPATWAMLILGFGVVGSILREVGRSRRAKPVTRRRRRQQADSATA